jgi:hypothetical protein
MLYFDYCVLCLVLFQRNTSVVAGLSLILPSRCIAHLIATKANLQRNMLTLIDIQFLAQLP